MLLSGATYPCCLRSPHHLSQTSKRPISAKNPDFSNGSKSMKTIIFDSKKPKQFLAQSAIAVLGLGFIDAGYSGDWSRIGVISKEFEDVLKISAILVVPLCLFLIYSISNKLDESLP